MTDRIARLRFALACSSLVLGGFVASCTGDSPTSLGAPPTRLPGSPAIPAFAVTAGIGGSFSMPASGNQITAMPLTATGISVADGTPVRVLVGAAITRQPTAGLLFFCSTDEWKWACDSFWSDLVSDQPIPPAGIFGFYARAFASWNGAEPGNLDGSSELSLTGPAQGELYAGRAGWECYYELNVKNPDGSMKYPYDFGPCHTFGGGYTVTLQPNDGGGRLVLTASKNQLPAEGGSVSFDLSTSDSSTPSDISWEYVDDAPSPPPPIAAARPEAAPADAQTTIAAAAEHGDVFTLDQAGHLVPGRPQDGGILLIRRPTRGVPPLTGRSPSRASASPSARSGSSAADACADQTSCTIGITAAGTMVARASVAGAQLSASVRIKVGGGGSSRSLRIMLQPTTNDMVNPLETGADHLIVVVSVLDADGAPLPNRLVRFSLQAAEGTAGHSHTGNKPAGSMAAANTGATGRVDATYVAGPASGLVTVRATADSAQDTVITINVGISGLVELTADTGVALIGTTTSHPSNHWGTQGTVDGVRTLGRRYFKEYNDRMQVNDMSLELGGVFDLNGNWATPHAEHRVGQSVDFHTQGLPTRRLDFVRTVWEDEIGGTVYDETGTSGPHYHLRF